MFGDKVEVFFLSRNCKKGHFCLGEYNLDSLTNNIIKYENELRQYREFVQTKNNFTTQKKSWWNELNVIGSFDVSNKTREF